MAESVFVTAFVTALATTFRTTLAALAALGVCLLAPGAARADGAFPDAQTILTPADTPGEIVLVTNFGLIQSEDAGATWLWACEQSANAFGAFYQLGLPPRRRLYTVANRQVMFSDDRSCGWSAAGGLVPDPGAGVSDVWVDRTVVDRVLAVNVTCCDAGERIHSVLESLDGGDTFDTLLYAADRGATITGVESARSDPRTIYVTLTGAPPDGAAPPPILAHTIDGGLHWSAVDLTGQVGAGVVRLVAVDPENPRKVLLLWNGAGSQALVMTTDAGVSASKTLVPTGLIKAFLRLTSGTMLVATDADATAGLFRSRDGGARFDAVPGSPHVRALSERAGRVYAATDNFADGYAVGVSTDEGSTWSPLLSYQDVRAIVPCLKAACQTTCDAEVQLALWSKDVCSADPPPIAGGAGGAAVGGLDGGASGATGATAGGGAAGHGIGVGGAAGGAALGGTPRGCGCSVAPAGAPIALLAVGTALAGLGVGARRRRRR